MARGIEIIAVGTAFKRFLDIAKILGTKVAVVCDNDGDPVRKEALFEEYKSTESICIFIDDDAEAHTLEPQLIKANGIENLNEFLGKSYTTKDELKDFMTKNKTECALTIYNSAKELTAPTYIEKAIDTEDGAK